MKELIFGEDLIKILEKNGYNEIGNTVTKYKNGSKSIFFMYSMISNIDELKVDTPFIQFDVDDETNGLIDIVCFPNGEKGDGIECKSEIDILWFIENANWKNSDLTESYESKKSNRKSLKEENNRQKVTEGIIKYFNDMFPIIEKDDSFRFSMYTKNNVMIGIELFKDYIFVGLFNLDGKNNLDETIEIERFDDGNIANEILYDSDAIYEYLEEYKLI